MSHAQHFDHPLRPISFVGWKAALNLATMLGFFAYMFIGTQPFGDPSAAQRVDGSSLDRIAVLGLFALALAALAANWRATLEMAPRNLLLGCLVLFCLASTLWSDHPDLTIRRAILLVMLATVAAGAAAGVENLRRFHTLLFVTLFAIVLLNLAATVAAPGYSITDIGIRGFYSQKNVAGVVAMIAAVTAATWTLGASDRRSVMLGLAALVPILAFLMLTRSKTSIMLVALAFLVMGAVWLAERLGPRVIALAAAAAAVSAAALVAAFVATDFDAARFTALFTPDASFTGRDQLWRFAIDRSLERPLLGHGYGAFWDVGPGADPLLRVDPGSWLGDVEIGTINQAHNGYLELWLQVGLPAMVMAALLVLLTAIVAAKRFFVDAAPAGDRWMIVLMGTILVLHLLHNLSEASLLMRGLPFCNVVLLMLLIASRCHPAGVLRTGRS
ncbi:O-antigen ligase family protein [Methylopila sp. M107]|uniref:O-antigen ligase family protein n=1 Tax=Methylopila sp. M107 TaxID=1101190 RepID=UPI00036A093D|nr:O-antigen ligase family protein [Methylopila sp. M107]